MRLIDRSILVGQAAEGEIAALKARALAIAPWIAIEAAPSTARGRGEA